MKTPILLVVLYNRFYELEQNLPKMRELCKKEIGVDPVVVVVWSDPKVGYLWIFQDLLDDGHIQHLLTRLPEDDKGHNISYNCARDLHLGLDFITKHYPDSYVIAHCADVLPREGIYLQMHGTINSGKDAFLVMLPNSIVTSNIWHTNFFAATLNKKYWPPIINDGDPDILEHKWGKELLSNGLNNFDYCLNYNDKTFYHIHDTERQTSIHPLMFQDDNCGLSLNIIGSKTLFRRIKDYWRNKWQLLLRLLIPKRKS